MKTTLYIDGDRHCPFTAEFTQEQAKQLQEITVDNLLQFMKHQMVGKLVSKPEEEAYFTPRFEIAGFSLSLQLNYYLWNMRVDNGTARRNPEKHAEPMTAEEWAKLISANAEETVVDFFMSYKGQSVFNPGQATLKYIVGYLNGVGDSLAETLEDHSELGRHEGFDGECDEAPVLMNIKISTDDITVGPQYLTGKKGIITLEDGYSLPIEILVVDITE